MASSSLVRWSGPASILGAVLIVVQIALSSALEPDQAAFFPYKIHDPLFYVAYNLLFNAALLLFVVGLIGLHARQAERGHSGRLGSAGLFLALSAGVLAAAGVVATLVVGLWPVVVVPLVLFAQLLAVFCLIIGVQFLGIAGMRAPASRDWISSLRWRWALLILATGLVAALLSDVLRIIVSSDIPVLNMKGSHLLHVLLTIPAAIWVGRKIGATPVLYGVLVGLVSGVANQVVDHVILNPGTLRSSELLLVLTMSVGAGWLGGIVARSTLAEQETLYQTSQAIGETSNAQDIVDAIGEHLTDLQASHVALWQDVSKTQDNAPAELSLLAVWVPQITRVWGPGVWRPGLRLDEAQVPVLTRSFRQRSPLVFRVRKLPASERAVWEHQGIRSAVLLPLIASSGRQLGLLMVASRSTYSFSRIKLRTYVTIGAQAALVLENLRLVEQAQQAGVSQERQRLAHEIHDTLAQGFTSIVMHLEAAEGVLPSDSSPVQQYLEQARSIARDSLAEARRLMWALRPESLERSSLPEALAELAAEHWSGEGGATATTTVIGTPHSLTPEIEVTLLRVAQEALTNCRKYAQASQVVITLSYTNNLVILNVQDDGVGFDPAQLSTTEPRPQSTGGFGLMGMRERVEHLRGTLLIESEPGRGTTLMVAIPMTAGKQVVGGAQAVRGTL